MERLLRLILVLGLAAFGLWVAKYLHENPVDGEIARLSTEVARLEAANQTIRQDNERVRTLVRGLREDPRVLERRARDTLGVSRAGELIILFDDARHSTAPASSRNDSRAELDRAP